MHLQLLKSRKHAVAFNGHAKCRNAIFRSGTMTNVSNFNDDKLHGQCGNVCSNSLMQLLHITNCQVLGAGTMLKEVLLLQQENKQIVWLWMQHQSSCSY